MEKDKGKERYHLFRRGCYLLLAGIPELELDLDALLEVEVMNGTMAILREQ